jgi:hypothetical protein
MTNSCDNDSYILKPIEKCSYRSMHYLNQLNSTKYSIDASSNIEKIFKDDLINKIPELNTSIRNSSNNNYIYKYDVDNKQNVCVKTDNDDEYYVNCVIQTQNPLFTYKNGFCMLNPDLQLPNELKKLKNKDEILVKINNSILEDEEGNFKYQKVENKKYCEDKWYDWIIIPNYHLGNRILKDYGDYSKEDVKICYANCGIGELPYVNNNGVKLCVSKEFAFDGKYENKLDYSPISLINMIGNNKRYLNFLYKNLFFYKLYQKKNFSINLDVKFSNNLENHDNYIIDEVYGEIKTILEKMVTENDINNVKELSTNYKTFSYKHPNFKENDLITLLGMDKNEILSNDIILIHTAYLGYYYYNFFEILNRSVEYKDNKLEFTQDNGYYNNGVDLVDNFLQLNNTFSLKRKQRFANILYKAINICYDNKTDFSKNLINRTLEACNNYLSIFEDMKTRYIDVYNNNNIIKSNDIDKFFNFIKRNQDNIKNGFEIEYFLHEKYNKYKYDVSNLKGNPTSFNTTTKEGKKIVDDFYDNRILFYKEEEIEIQNKNKCKAGQLIVNGECSNCLTYCDKSKCQENDNNCKIYCSSTCTTYQTVNGNEKLRCGGIENTLNNEKPLKNKFDDIKTPIEEETIFPDFSYLLKSGIKIFFLLIFIYIGYIFYNVFNETILTFGNILWGIIDWIRLSKDKIKAAEYYENIIQNKYDRVIRKTMNI